MKTLEERFEEFYQNGFLEILPFDNQCQAEICQEISWDKRLTPYTPKTLKTDGSVVSINKKCMVTINEIVFRLDNGLYCIIYDAEKDADFIFNENTIVVSDKHEYYLLIKGQSTTILHNSLVSYYNFINGKVSAILEEEGLHDEINIDVNVTIERGNIDEDCSFYFGITPADYNKENDHFDDSNFLRHSINEEINDIGVSRMIHKLNNRHINSTPELHHGKTVESIEDLNLLRLNNNLSDFKLFFIIRTTNEDDIRRAISEFIQG